MKKIALVAILIICFFIQISAQTLKVISTKKELKHSIVSNWDYMMIDIKDLIPDIILDLRYGTRNNFMNTKLYKNANTTYLRYLPANALVLGQKILKEKGYGFKIYDAYRPYSVTKKMWDLIHDDRYVANPAGGSGHNRGTSVDITIVKLATGQELDMGTAFDNFTDSAHHSFTPNLSAEIIENRKLLENIMVQIGFKRLETEWWHYSWICKEPYDVLDFNFKKMRKLFKIKTKVYKNLY